MSQPTPAQQAEQALIQLLKDMDRWVDSLPIQRAGSSRLTQNAMPYIAALRAAPVSAEAAQQTETSLSQRIRPNSEAAPWVIEEVRRMEAAAAALRAAVSPQALADAGIAR